LRFLTGFCSVAGGVDVDVDVDDDVDCDVDVLLEEKPAGLLRSSILMVVVGS
jgi:hypothetical protein